MSLPPHPCFKRVIKSEIRCRLHCHKWPTVTMVSYHFDHRDLGRWAPVYSAMDCKGTHAKLACHRSTENDSPINVYFLKIQLECYSLSCRDFMHFFSLSTGFILCSVFFGPVPIGSKFCLDRSMGRNFSMSSCT